MENIKSKIAKSYAAAAIFTILAVVFDQYTKYLAVVYLKDKQPYILIPGVFELRYLENRGAAFGIMQNQQVFFIIITSIVMATVLLVYRKIPYTNRYIPMRICMMLLCSGAIGNLIDRVQNNYVVDFFYFSLIDFPIFNVADCYVVVTCFLFAFLILFYYKDEELNCLSLKKRREKE